MGVLEKTKDLVSMLIALFIFCALHGIAVFAAILFNSSVSNAGTKCVDAQLIPTAANMTHRQAERMLVDATYADNKGISRTEKVRRVESNMETHRNPLPDISDRKLAEWVVDIAKCTGHDFSILAGLIRKESTYCLAKLNTSSRKSTASGCGQITIWPVREFKDHLVLPGRRGSGDPEARASLEKLINSCLGNRADEFLELLSESPNEVKAYLRNESDYQFDLFMAALYLKYHYGRTGFYYDPNRREAGALSLYGEGSSYGRSVERFAEGVQKSSQTCFDDTEYIKEIERTSCELSNDSAACSLTTPSWEI